MASAQEREIRDAVVAWFHHNEPQGRVVHELPLSSFSGNGRADLGIVFPDHLVLIEIKSEKDKLDRLEKQFTEMVARAHDLKIVCHEKWFEPDGGLKGQSWMRYSHAEHLWQYPAQKEWRFDRYRAPAQPHPANLLDYLWAEEMRACYELAGAMAAQRGTTMLQMRRDLVDKLTGRQVKRAVCALLRARVFLEADAPIPLDRGN